MVIAMQLDALDDSIIDSSEERTLKLDLKGYAVVYNRLNDSFINIGSIAIKLSPKL